MKWSTHLRIISRVLEHLSLDNIYIQNAREGSIAPDKFFKDNTDHRFNAAGTVKIRKHIQQARTEYLTGNLQNACYELGVASHYIADGMTMVHLLDIPATNPRHEQYEEEIDRVDRSIGQKLMIDAAKDSPFEIMGPDDIYSTTSYMKNRRNQSQKRSGPSQWYPEDDLYLTYYFTHHLGKNIFVEKELPDRYSNIAAENILRNNTRKKFVIASFAYPLMAGVGMYLLAGTPLFALLGAAAMLFLQQPYFKLRKALLRKDAIYASLSNQNKIHLSASSKKAWFLVPKTLYE